ncbi:uncharacterized protein LOC113295656 [Papaver somniferum]|uniref:uncharacterized protein LOC113295656 n=1 Tax=Papaver somniferum TaxID=3469 RepID=UPI000E6FDC58|nr:uncharacterized protein LOC113295656 [Papaver somniferum]
MGETQGLDASNTSLITTSFASIVKGNKTLTVEHVAGEKTHITTTVDGADFQEVKTSLEQQWKLREGWVQFVSLNRGFFIIKLLSQEDKDRVFTEEGWMVKQQQFRFIEWYPGFDANKPPSSRATVWVRFPGLPMELWVEKTLLSLGKSLGNPIVVDSRTLNHEYGHFASVLIDIDFASHDADEIHVVDGRNFLQAIDIPKRPSFCSSCKIIGHLDAVRDKNKEVNHVQAIHNDAKEAAVVNDWKEVRHKKHGESGSVVIPTVVVSVDNNASLTPLVDQLLQSERVVHQNKFDVLHRELGLDNDTSDVLLETEEEKELGNDVDADIFDRWEASRVTRKADEQAAYNLVSTGSKENSAKNTQCTQVEQGDEISEEERTALELQKKWKQM